MAPAFPETPVAGSAPGETAETIHAEDMEVQQVMSVGYNPIEDTVGDDGVVRVDDLEAEVTHEPVTTSELEAATPGEYAEWVQSMACELKSFDDQNCKVEYDLSDAVSQGLVRRDMILPMMIVASRKPQIGMDTKKKKVRAVLCGNWQILDSAVETYSQVPEWGHVRAALSLASRMKWALGVLDVSTASLNSPLKEPVWAYPPAAFTRAGLVESGKVWKFVRSVYGLKQAPADWTRTRDPELKALVVKSGGKSYKLFPCMLAPQIFQVRE
eukprot:6005518-Amphidinium_carterae.1